MEVNHIVPEAEGGPDSLDNAIPLCFDCHAEVGHYNLQHPKGNKFTPNELRAHRDSWYAKVAASGGVVSSPEHVELDRKLFRRFASKMPVDGSMLALQHLNVESAFDFSKVAHDYWAAVDFCSRVDTEFIDEDLEKLRSDLMKALGDFFSLLAKKTFPDDAIRAYNRIPPEWAHTKSKLYFDTVNDLIELQCLALKSFSDFVSMGRRKLGIDYHSGVTRLPID